MPLALVLMVRTVSYFFLGVALMLEVTGMGDLVDMVPLLALGQRVELHFDEAWKAASFAELWSRRWNITVTGVLRPVCYDPVMEAATESTLTTTTQSGSSSTSSKTSCGRGGGEGDGGGSRDDTSPLHFQNHKEGQSQSPTTSSIPLPELLASLSPDASSHSSSDGSSCSPGSDVCSSSFSSISGGSSGSPALRNMLERAWSGDGVDGGGVDGDDGGGAGGGCKSVCVGSFSAAHRRRAIGTSAAEASDAVPPPVQKSKMFTAATPAPPNELNHQSRRRGQSQPRQPRTATAAAPSGSQAANLHRSSRARRFAAVQMTFLVSGLWHELVCYSMSGTTTGGSWLLLFALQAPLILVESELRHKARKLRLRVPRAIKCWIVHGLLFLQLMLLWYPPMERTGMLEGLTRTGDRVMAAAAAAAAVARRAITTVAALLPAATEATAAALTSGSNRLELEASDANKAAQPAAAAESGNTTSIKSVGGESSVRDVGSSGEPSMTYHIPALGSEVMRLLDQDSEAQGASLQGPVSESYVPGGESSSGRASHSSANAPEASGLVPVANAGGGGTDGGNPVAEGRPSGIWTEGSTADTETADTAAGAAVSPEPAEEQPQRSAGSQASLGSQPSVAGSTSMMYGAGVSRGVSPVMPATEDDADGPADVTASAIGTAPSSADASPGLAPKAEDSGASATGSGGGGGGGGEDGEGGSAPGTSESADGSGAGRLLQQEEVRTEKRWSSGTSRGVAPAKDAADADVGAGTTDITSTGGPDAGSGASPEYGAPGTADDTADGGNVAAAEGGRRSDGAVMGDGRSGSGAAAVTAARTSSDRGAAAVSGGEGGGGGGPAEGGGPGEGAGAAAPSPDVAAAEGSGGVGGGSGSSIGSGVAGGRASSSRSRSSGGSGPGAAAAVQQPGAAPDADDLPSARGGRRPSYSSPEYEEYNRASTPSGAGSRPASGGGSDGANAAGTFASSALAGGLSGGSGSERQRRQSSGGIPSPPRPPGNTAQQRSSTTGSSAASQHSSAVLRQASETTGAAQFSGDGGAGPGGAADYNEGQPSWRPSVTASSVGGSSGRHGSVSYAWRGSSSGGDGGGAAALAMAAAAPRPSGSVEDTAAPRLTVTNRNTSSSSETSSVARRTSGPFVVQGIDNGSGGGGGSSGGLAATLVPASPSPQLPPLGGHPDAASGMTYGTAMSSYSFPGEARRQASQSSAAVGCQPNPLPPLPPTTPPGGILTLGDRPKARAVVSAPAGDVRSAANGGGGAAAAATRSGRPPPPIHMMPTHVQPKGPFDECTTQAALQHVRTVWSTSNICGIRSLPNALSPDFRHKPQLSYGLEGGPLGMPLSVGQKQVARINPLAGMFTQFEYLPSEYDRVKLTGKYDRLRHKLAQTGPQEFVVRAPPSAVHGAPAFSEFSYTTDPVDSYSASMHADTDLARSKVVAGPFYPSGRVQAAKVLKGRLDECMMRLCKQLSDDWPNSFMQVFEDRNGSVVASFHQPSAVQEGDLSAYMNTLAKRNHVMSTFQLTKDATRWGLVDEDSGAVFYVLWPPWVRHRYLGPHTAPTSTQMPNGRPGTRGSSSSEDEEEEDAEGADGGFATAGAAGEDAAAAAALGLGAEIGDGGQVSIGEHQGPEVKCVQLQLGTFQKLFQIFAEKQKAQRPKRWDMMEWRHADQEVGMEVFCNPNAHTTAFDAKLLITLWSSGGLRVTTEARLSAITSDLDNFLQG
ncbi:hypothetical protein VOLCADRAFT_120968 [Volvox carteri f. nagariensis]|uniref:Wax synthase domain-containing protein n=1 Tax=Volvox carteri f. nagariensis TaxID=3068 RepID=D8TYJ3_VOLCA|nr:uncharacterized protein VOLCADRAFT_120968 [Volvox carteri f. nagariensis]EFJ47320.1 hypothetical protein VOLCADRAFT_120968 [Volvox carteri f. nagariensis]|eukprot:XP_002951509.1 hypothetical protein VOLCADRAFT_120968 [Volvox carteri f. nagariensis]